MLAFDEARSHVEAALNASDPDARRLLVQLGDLGTGKTSGGLTAFQTARAYLDSFTVPTELVTGNHDLEGFEFDTDEENLRAWQTTMRQEHFWWRDVGPCVLVGLSTTRYRSNVLSNHEVHIDDQQLEWFRERLEQDAPEKPVVVFTHAPPMGCGLKVLNDLHVKNRCAWLNHSANPHVFMELVAAHPRIRLWFSGHFHLSQNYADSISVASGCVFVQTGVIGKHSNRDGFRQSRMLRVTHDAFEVYTIDHEDGGAVRLDMQSRWDFDTPPEKLISDEELVCDPAAGYVCARDACSVLWHDGIRWFATGPHTLLAQQDDALIEYDVRTFAPTGALTLKLGGSTVVLRDEEGRDVTDDIPGDGSCISCVEIRDQQGEVQQSFGRNAWGNFFQVYQHSSRWQQKRQALLDGLAKERETIMI